MKEIPNKIFIDEDLIVYHCLTDRHDGDLEYIRKSALLEWAKEQKRDCERLIREHPEDESLWCERDKYDELIDKINSM